MAHRILRNTAAALLQTNQPVPQRTDAEIAAEMEANYRWNFAVNVLDGAGFFFGISFVSSNTMAPLFISKLTTNPLAFGLVAVIAQASWFLPQIFTANLIERLPRRKPVVIRLGFFLERVPMWVLVLSALVAVRSPLLALALFFIGYAWHGLGAGMIAPAWQDMLARCFPVARRGRFFGTSAFFGTLMGTAGAALSIWILGNFEFSTNFVYTFTIGAMAMMLSWCFLSFTREPVPPSNPTRQNSREFLANLPGIVRRDHNFRRFLIARSLIALGGLAGGFVTVSAIQRWQVPDSTVGVYTAVYLLGQAIANVGFGLLADRLGHKLPLELGALAAALAFGLAWLAPSPQWVFVTFFLLGVSYSSTLVSGIMIALEFSRPERRPTYVGIANTAVGLVSIVAPLLGAWLAGIDYGWLFAVGAVANVAALAAMRWWVREPRWSAMIDG